MHLVALRARRGERAPLGNRRQTLLPCLDHLALLLSWYLVSLFRHTFMFISSNSHDEMRVWIRKSNPSTIESDSVVGRAEEQFSLKFGLARLRSGPTLPRHRKDGRKAAPNADFMNALLYGLLCKQATEKFIPGWALHIKMPFKLVSTPDDSI